MRLQYLCASLNRADGLKRLVASSDAPIVVAVESEPRAIWRFWGDLAKESTADIVVFVNDYLEIGAGCADAIKRAFDEWFYDGDGVVGLNRSKPSGFPAAHLAIGRPFLNRFPSGQHFCPEYWHFFSDTEFYTYASKLNKFHHELTANVIVHEVKRGDSTYRDSRLLKVQDRSRYEARQQAGLLWGESFDMIGEPA